MFGVYENEKVQKMAWLVLFLSINWWSSSSRVGHQSQQQWHHQLNFLLRTLQITLLKETAQTKSANKITSKERNLLLKVEKVNECGKWMCTDDSFLPQTIIAVCIIAISCTLPHMLLFLQWVCALTAWLITCGSTTRTLAVFQGEDGVVDARNLVRD